MNKISENQLKNLWSDVISEDVISKRIRKARELYDMLLDSQYAATEKLNQVRHELARSMIRVGRYHEAEILIMQVKHWEDANCPAGTSFMSGTLNEMMFIAERVFGGPNPYQTEYKEIAEKIYSKEELDNDIMYQLWVNESDDSEIEKLIDIKRAVYTKPSYELLDKMFEFAETAANNAVKVSVIIDIVRFLQEHSISYQAGILIETLRNYCISDKVNSQEELFGVCSSYFMNMCIICRADCRGNLRNYLNDGYRTGRVRRFDRMLFRAERNYHYGKFGRVKRILSVISSNEEEFKQLSPLMKNRYYYLEEMVSGDIMSAFLKRRLDRLSAGADIGVTLRNAFTLYNAGRYDMAVSNIDHIILIASDKDGKLAELPKVVEALRLKSRCLAKMGCDYTVQAEAISKEIEAEHICDRKIAEIKEKVKKLGDHIKSVKGLVSDGMALSHMFYR